MRTYVPSGKCKEGAYTAMLLYGATAAVLLAVLVGVVTHWFDFVVIIALGLGAGVGAAIRYGGKKGQCRNPALLTFLSLALGLTVYGGKLYVNSRMVAWDNQKSMIPILLEKGATREQAEKAVPRIYDEWLFEKTGSRGFVGYVNLLAKNGISISSRGGDGGLNIGVIGTIILLVLEAAGSAWAAWATATPLNQEPYCENCLCWIDESWSRFTVAQAVTRAAEGLEADPGSISRAETLGAPWPSAPPEGLKGKLSLRQCPTCKKAYLSGHTVTPSSKGDQPDETAVFLNAVVDADEATALMKAPEAPADDG